MKTFFGKTTQPHLFIAILLLTAALLLACGPASKAGPQGKPVSQVATQDSDPGPQGKPVSQAAAQDSDPGPQGKPVSQAAAQDSDPAPQGKPVSQAAAQDSDPAPQGKPVSQAAAQDSDPGPTTTPTPTATPEPPQYPNLDTFLQDLVTKYEAGDLSEIAAAARAPVYDGSSVLVEVDLSTNIDAVYTWMGSQDISPRYKDAEYVPPHIYAYVPVSLLGALSQRDGVALVQPVQDMYGAFAASQGAGGASGASAPDSTSEPKLPLWLKDYPYPKLKGKLAELVYRYEQGELTAEQVVSEFGDKGKGSSIRVQIELPPDPANTDAVANWLKSKGLSSLRVRKHESYPNIISGFVPVSLMAELSQHPGIWRVRTPGRPGGGSKGGSPRAPTSQSTEQSSAPPTPSPQEQHEADHWSSAGYEGNGVKVGIIDQSFDGFRSLMGTELPQGYRVEAQCYTYDLDTTPSTNIADCGDNIAKIDYHGTAVAQAVYDVAPLVSLYISNASILVNTDESAERLKNDVKWMIGKGVDIINYSQNWPFSEGLGDGTPRHIDSPLDTVCTALTRGTAATCNATVQADATDVGGIIWVNSAGNRNQSIWHGPFSDTGTQVDNYHNYTSTDDRNYINLVAGTKVTAEMRWDDSWGGVDCDLDLKLYRDGLTTPVDLVIELKLGVPMIFPTKLSRITPP